MNIEHGQANEQMKELWWRAKEAADAMFQHSINVGVPFEVARDLHQEAIDLYEMLAKHDVRKEESP